MPENNSATKEVSATIPFFPTIFPWDEQTSISPTIKPVPDSHPGDQVIIQPFVSSPFDKDGYAEAVGRQGLLWEPQMSIGEPAVESDIRRRIGLVNQHLGAARGAIRKKRWGDVEVPSRAALQELEGLVDIKWGSTPLYSVLQNGLDLLHEAIFMVAAFNSDPDNTPAVLRRLERVEKDVRNQMGNVTDSLRDAKAKMLLAFTSMRHNAPWTLQRVEDYENGEKDIHPIRSYFENGFEHWDRFFAAEFLRIELIARQVERAHHRGDRKARLQLLKKLLSELEQFTGRYSIGRPDQKEMVALIEVHTATLLARMKLWTPALKRIRRITESPAYRHTWAAQALFEDPVFERYVEDGRLLTPKEIKKRGGSLKRLWSRLKATLANAHPESLKQTAIIGGVFAAATMLGDLAINGEVTTIFLPPIIAGAASLFNRVINGWKSQEAKEAGIIGLYDRTAWESAQDVGRLVLQGGIETGLWWAPTKLASVLPGLAEMSLATSRNALSFYFGWLLPSSKINAAGGDAVASVASPDFWDYAWSHFHDYFMVPYNAATDLYDAVASVASGDAVASVASPDSWGPAWSHLHDYFMVQYNAATNLYDAVASVASGDAVASVASPDFWDYAWSHFHDYFMVPYSGATALYYLTHMVSPYKFREKYLKRAAKYFVLGGVLLGGELGLMISGESNAGERILMSGIALFEGLAMLYVNGVISRAKGFWKSLKKADHTALVSIAISVGISAALGNLIKDKSMKYDDIGLIMGQGVLIGAWLLPVTLVVSGFLKRTIDWPRGFKEGWQDSKGSNIPWRILQGLRGFGSAWDTPYTKQRGIRVALHDAPMATARTAMGWGGIEAYIVWAIGNTIFTNSAANMWMPEWSSTPWGREAFLNMLRGGDDEERGDRQEIRDHLEKATQRLPLTDILGPHKLLDLYYRLFAIQRVWNPYPGPHLPVNEYFANLSQLIRRGFDKSPSQQDEEVLLDETEALVDDAAPSFSQHDVEILLDETEALVLDAAPRSDAKGDVKEQARRQKQVDIARRLVLTFWLNREDETYGEMIRDFFNGRPLIFRLTGINPDAVPVVEGDDRREQYKFMKEFFKEEETIELHRRKVKQFANRDASPLVKGLYEIALEIWEEFGGLPPSERVEVPGQIDFETDSGSGGGGGGAPPSTAPVGTGSPPPRGAPPVPDVAASPGVSVHVGGFPQERRPQRPRVRINLSPQVRKKLRARNGNNNPLRNPFPLPPGPAGVPPIILLQSTIRPIVQ